MKVRAIKNGFYGGKYRHAGEVFVLVAVEGVAGPDRHRSKKTFTVDQQFSPVWMEKVDGRKISAPAAEQKPSDITPAGAGAPTGDEDVI